MKTNPRTVRTTQMIEEKVETSRIIAVAFTTSAIFAALAAFIALLLPSPQQGGAANLVDESTLVPMLGSTVYRARTFMIGYGPVDNYTNTLGWDTIGQNYNPHIGCRGFAGQNGEDDPDVRVDDYHRANPDGKMLAYNNTYHEWPATNIPGLARDEPSFLHAQEPARLRLIPGNGQVRVLWSDDGRGFSGAYAQGQQYLRGENITIGGYNVQRSANPNGPFVTVNPSPVPYKQDTPTIHQDQGMEYVDTGVTNGTTYYYKVVSREGTADLAFSDVQPVVPTASPQPSITIASIDTREVLDYHTTPSLRDWTYTLTFMVEGSPDEVRLHFDYDKDLQIESPDNGQGQNEIIVLAPTEPEKYVFTSTQNPLLDTLPYRAPGFGFFVEAQKGVTIARAPQADFYSTTINNRAIEKNFGEFALQRTSTVFRDWFEGQMAYRVSPSDGCDGTFGDVVQLDPQATIDVIMTGYEQTTWIQQYVDWLAALDQPQYGPFVLNICPTRAQLAIVGPVSQKALGEVGDGFLCEGFGVAGGTRHWTSWVAGELEGAITAVQQYQQPVFLAPRPRNDLTSDGIKDREYGIAAYNIARENWSYFYASDELSSPVYEWPGDYPENTLHLGQPIDTSSDGTITAYKMGASYPQNALLRRRFANGVVVMNTVQPGMGEPDQTIQLGGSYYRVLLRNGILSGKVRDGGYLEISQAPQTSVTLSPAEAAVFVTSPTGLPLCAESWVCSAWSACVDGQQNRTCTDEHECGATVNQPPLVQACDSAPPVISNITVTNITQTSAIVNWTTNEPSTSRVEYGTTPAYGSTTVENPALVTTHAVTLTDLTEGTIYHFRVHSRDTVDNAGVSTDQTFTTTVCTEDWVCGSWGPCLDGQQTRTCTDQNSCGTFENQPPLVQACDSTPPVISDITVTNRSRTTAIVNWTTNEPSTSRVEYGTTPAYGSTTVENPALVTTHAVTLTDLTEGTIYHFRVHSRDAGENATVSGDDTFTTLTCNELWVCSEWGTCIENQQTRTCTDQNSCGTFENQPPLVQACDSTPPLISSITAEGITTTSATVHWTSDEFSTSQVEYGRSESYGFLTPVSRTYIRSHVVTLADLAPGAEYHYRVRSADGSRNEAVSGNQTFTTLSEPAAPPENPPESCREQWSCTVWSACENGTETRTCSDTNRCGTIADRPPLSRECGVGGPPVPLPPTELLVAPAVKAGPQVKRYRANGSLLSQFFAYTKNYRGGVTLASGDLNGDGKKEIVAGTGPSSAPDIRVFNENGKLLGQFFAFSKTSKTGASVTVADLDGDGSGEIVVAPLNGVPMLRVFQYQQNVRRFRLIGQTLSVPGLRSGLHLAAADLDGDGAEEILTVPAVSGAPDVSVYEFRMNTRSFLRRKRFSAFPSSFRGGLSVAAGDVNADGMPEIIIGAGPGNDPVVRIFRGDGKRLWGFLAFNTKHRGGVVVGTLQADDDMSLELVTGPRSGAVSTMSIRNVSLSPNRQSILRRITPYAKSFRNGVRINSR